MRESAIEMMKQELKWQSDRDAADRARKASKCAREASERKREGVRQKIFVI